MITKKIKTVFCLKHEHLNLNDYYYLQLLYREVKEIVLYQRFPRPIL